MSEAIQLSTRVPQNDDSLGILLAKLLAAQAQRVTGTALTAATRNATTQSAIIDCTGFRSIVVYLRVTAAPGTDTVRITLRGIDPASGTALLLAQSNTVSTVSSIGYSFGPGVGIAVSLPDQIRIEVSHSPSPSGSFEYSVGYCLVP
jgi:hypothetical protein